MVKFENPEFLKVASIAYTMSMSLKEMQESEISALMKSHEYLQSSNASKNKF